MVYRLNIDDVVIFKMKDDLMDGNIIWQDKDVYDISYLQGYESLNDSIHRADIIAIVDGNMNKENYHELYVEDSLIFRGYFFLVNEDDKIVYEREEKINV